VLLSCLAVVVALALPETLTAALFSRDLGLVGGIVSAGCYLIVSVSMAAVGVLPERSQAPLGQTYIA
jgi:DHA1 family bicyclomycin/chloramphenicol resistance-like MFS transporter